MSISSLEQGSETQEIDGFDAAKAARPAMLAGRVRFTALLLAKAPAQETPFPLRKPLRRPA